MTVPAAIEGVWLPFKAELGGESAPADVISKTEVRFTATTYTVRFGGEVADHGHYDLGEMPGQTTLTLKGKSGHNAGRVIPAIYQLSGDRLRICFGMDGVRPEAFSSQPGSFHYLVTYRRKILA